MNRPRLCGLATVLLAIVCLGACLPAWSATSTAGKGAGQESRKSSFWVAGWTFFLVPLSANPETSAEKATKAWRDLFAGMAKDAATQKLLTRLHGGWPAEFCVVNPKKAKDSAAFKTPPSAGMAIALRVADLDFKEVKTKRGLVPFRQTAFGHVVDIHNAEVASLPIGKKEPMPGEALELVMEEYFSRIAPGWIVLKGTGPGTGLRDDYDDQELRRVVEEAKLPASLADQRRDLERKIETYAAQASAFFGKKQ